MLGLRFRGFGRRLLLRWQSGRQLVLHELTVERVRLHELGMRPDAADLGFGRIVVSEKEVTIILVNIVYI